MTELERRIAMDLGATVLLAFADNPLEGHSARLESLTHPARILSYRRGRAALANILQRLGRTEDPWSVSFPHPEFSISHTAARAVAAAWPQGKGIGVDLEAADRHVSPGAMRLYLTQDELARHSDAPEETRLRLWTVKEALYKAHGHNAGLVLSSFSLDDPEAFCGTATSAGRSFRYGSWASESGWLAMALCL
ncbi:MAG: 4'-phosphopantetheinyl transferase superfamily protein [Candidatus Sericytochromatia bacterium]|nr:4'-phosphopantetheinyl transferase superfamily protein [Candidatus Sericytochromatia bacterium]